MGSEAMGEVINHNKRCFSFSCEGIDRKTYHKQRTEPKIRVPKIRYLAPTQSSCQGLLALQKESRSTRTLCGPSLCKHIRSCHGDVLFTPVRWERKGWTLDKFWPQKNNNNNNNNNNHKINCRELFTTGCPLCWYLLTPTLPPEFLCS